MTEIYLIRHAQAEGNLYRMMHGHWDGSVTALGLKQIDALAERFRTVHVDALWHRRMESSPAHLWLRQAVARVAVKAYAPDS